MDTTVGQQTSSNNLSNNSRETGHGFEQLAPTGQVSKTHSKTMAEGSTKWLICWVLDKAHCAKTPTVYAVSGNKSTSAAFRYGSQNIVIQPNLWIIFQIPGTGLWTGAT